MIAPTAAPPFDPDLDAQQVDEAVAAIRARTDLRPDIVLVLGSGLGALADEVEDAVVISTADVPHYPQSTVEGHAGQLVLGHLAGRPVLVVQGRVHLYEGHAPRDLGFPVRLAHALGAGGLLLTNAAGGINPAFGPGTLMLISDHLNLAFASPLGGAVARGETRFPDLSDPYSEAWREQARALALRERVAFREGVYVWVSGPSYETPAEIRFYAGAGADAVGMSTVPEAVQAAALGLPVLGISTITNPAAGLQDAPLNHEEVLEVGRQVRDRLATWVRAIVAETTLPSR
ncbi:purine-nucleoside phosphorylase [Rubrivirga sp. S365]|uniref:Purine nucleoside phosphorylase n=1 Tax=Rubrivirga litoralis TaxID=3075598 RepID=A0ABU3BNX6_9BACT|nr:MULTISPECIES: purine-nucleoside phosphorylase [unclassified Rubrivirga]MDT0630997.1 purine-nucleoside phosphorylase [Rubrivirga sp. F394]MDT7855023.1 purine-nucleoside phosphorylase [Rubrivirga sp. S365]